MSEKMRQHLEAHREWAESGGASGVRLVAPGAVLRGADLTGTDLTSADLTGADLTGAVLRGARLRDGVPTVPRLASAILDAIGPEGERLDMRQWHACETVHCVAGWTIVIASDAGAALESECGTSVAAALIWAASTGLPVPNYYGDNDSARAELRDAAAREVV